MKVRLAQHAFPDRPDWPIIKDDVPLGTEYEVIGFHADLTLQNIGTGETRDVDCFHVIGNGSEGWLPCVCFELAKETA